MGAVSNRYLRVTSANGLKDYGPAFADYFDEQNAAITTGSVSGDKVKLVALGVNDGLFDDLIQQQAYIDFAYENDYKQIIDADRRQYYLGVLNNRCIPALQTCRASGTDSACVRADNVCYQGIEGALTQEADFDVYDVRAGSNDPNPPKTYNQYLANPSVVAAIGAKGTYQECADTPGNKFRRTGDGKSLQVTFCLSILTSSTAARTFIPALSDVVNAGVRTVVVYTIQSLIFDTFADLSNFSGLETQTTSATGSATRWPRKPLLILAKRPLNRKIWSATRSMARRAVHSRRRTISVSCGYLEPATRFRSIRPRWRCKCLSRR